MNKKLVPFIIISIIILSFILRTYDLGGESIWFDEGASVYSSREPISTIVNMLSTGPYYILYYTILHFWIKLFGDSEFSIRFPSVIFGMLSVYVIYKLGKLIFNTKVGLLSSFILSISLYHIRYSQEARPYSLLVLLVLLSNYYLIKILENKEKKYIVGYIISSIFMIYAHGYGIFYIISQNIYYIIFKRKETRFWIIIQGIVLSFIILWLPYFSKRIDNSIENMDMLYVLQIPTFDSIYNTFKIFVGNEQILYIFITIIIIGLTIDLIIKGHYEDNIRKYTFVILWLFIPFVASIMISYAIVPLYHKRYLIASIPALILLFSKCISNIKKIPIILSILIIIIMLQIPLMNNYYREIEKDQWRDVVNYIEHAKKDNDKILLYPNFSIVSFGYYYKNDSDYIGIDGSSNISDIVSNGNRVWLITSQMQYKERKEELGPITRELYNNTYINEDIIKFNGIRINIYDKTKK